MTSSSPVKHSSRLNQRH